VEAPGIELRANLLEKLHFPKKAAQNPAHFLPDSTPVDPDLRKLMVAWPNLTAAARRQILKLLG